jgi:hypothetical protein
MAPTRVAAHLGHGHIAAGSAKLGEGLGRMATTEVLRPVRVPVRRPRHGGSHLVALVPLPPPNWSHAGALRAAETPTRRRGAAASIQSRPPLQLHMP